MREEVYLILAWIEFGQDSVPLSLPSQNKNSEVNYGRH